MKHVIKAVKGYTKYAILSPLLICIEAVIEAVIPYISGHIIIDQGIKLGDTDLVIKYSLLIAVLSIISFIGGVGSGYFATRASAGVGKNLRKNMYEKLQSFAFEDIDKFSTASLITRLTTDVSNVQMSFQMTIRICCRVPILFAATLVFAYLLYPEFANVYAIAAPIMLVLAFGATLPAVKYFKVMFKKYDRMNLVSQENINAMRTVKAYTTEDREIEKFRQASLETKKVATKADTLAVMSTPIAQTTINVCTVIVMTLGAMLIANGDKDSGFIGTVSSMITYGIQMLASLMMATAISIMIMMSKASLDRINEVMSQEPSIKDPDNPITEVKNGDVEFEHVYFSYSKNDVCALNDIDLKIPSGTVVGIFGSTGSSKTTFISMMARLYDVTKGSVKVGGVDVRNYSLKSLRDACAVVLQKNTLFSGTVRSNMLWGNEHATDEQIWNALKAAKADDFIQEKGGLDYVVEEDGANFSGGQKQRLCIARALLKNPKILILDDSTSAVDTKTDASIRENFKHSIPDATKFIISQRISSIQFADIILIFDKGKIVAKGRHEELIKSSDIYRDIYFAQAKSNENMSKEAKKHA